MYAAQVTEQLARDHAHGWKLNRLCNCYLYTVLYIPLFRLTNPEQKYYPSYGKYRYVRTGGRPEAGISICSRNFVD